MAFEIVMPRLGWNMETGRLVEWLKRDGDPVTAGELLFVVESDKATQDVEAVESGILCIAPGAAAPGQDVAVGALLGYLLAPGEKPPAAGPPGVANEMAGSAAGQVTPQARRPSPTSPRHVPAISPRARRLAGELGVEWRAVTGSGRTGRIVERDVRRAAVAQAAAPQVGQETPPAPRVSPMARHVAKELGVDLARLRAAQPGKRIERVDVEAAARTVAHAAVHPMPPAVPPTAAVPQHVGTIRRLTAERMAAAAHTTAPVTLTTEADATELVRLREQLKADGAPVVPSYTDLLAKLAAQALMEHPAVNARFEGDRIVQAAMVNIGIAVDTERGLLVPVLRNVQSRSVRELAVASAALIGRVQTGSATPDDLLGGTFTITNLGMYEIDAFTPIINLPECAILGAGRIVAKQVVVDEEVGRVAIRRMMFLSLTFDHRLVDGAPAARFLQRIKQYVEQPYLWLVG